MSLAGTKAKPVISASERKSLDEAIEYVSKGWLPISPKIISLVRENLKAGKYESERDELLADLKKDFSLFTWFLSKLDQLGNGEESTRTTSLEDLVRQIEIKNLIEVFNQPDQAQNSKKMQSALKPQALALKQAIVAASVAGSAADKKRLNSDLAHMCAGVRQLGINLVAWNYPRIYSRATEQCAKGKETLEQALTKILGCAPIDLGSEIALKWEKSGGIAAFVSNDPDKLSNLSEEAKNLLGVNPNELFECVELGETVSKLIAPELHAQAANSLHLVIEDVEKIFGKGGMDELRNTLRTVAESYSVEGTDPFSLDIDPEKVTTLARQQLAEISSRDNVWISKCNTDLQAKFKNLYSHVDGETVSPTAINILVGEVMPALGFTRGCVFLVESASMRLNPILRIGDAPLSRYKPLDCSGSEKSSHPVITALGYSAPFIQENVPVYGEFVSHITGIFGNKAKTGVLYLEMSEKLSRSADRSEALISFKAARQALADCLNLR